MPTTMTISHLEIPLALHSKDRQSGCVPDGQSGRAQKSDVAFSASFRLAVARHDVCIDIISTTRRMHPRNETRGRIRESAGNQQSLAGRERRTGYSMSVPSALTRYWDIFDSIDFTHLGSTTWESPWMAAPTGDGEASTTTTPRENGASAGGGTPSSDGTAMPQWRGRGGGGGIATARTLPAGRIGLVV